MVTVWLRRLSHSTRFVVGLVPWMDGRKDGWLDGRVLCRGVAHCDGRFEGRTTATAAAGLIQTGQLLLVLITLGKLTCHLLIRSDLLITLQLLAVCLVEEREALGQAR